MRGLLRSRSVDRTSLVDAASGRGLGTATVALTLVAMMVAIWVVPPTVQAESSAGDRASLGARATLPNRQAPLRVFAAASLTEVVEALAASFPDGAVVVSFGASSDLARQIRDGAPADVFLSASPEWIDFLRDAGALVGAPVRVARNALVCVAARGGSLAPTAKDGAAASLPIRDLRALLERITADGDLVAIATEGVPAGDYAREALAKLGLAAAFEPRLVGQKDVRAVLHAVEQGEVAAGFVYATDARIARVETLFRFDPATHPPVEYLAVMIRNADSPPGSEPPRSRDLAHRFVAYLESDSARARLSAAGFVLP